MQIRRFEKLTLPYSWKEQDNTITIEQTSTGYVIESDFCGYRMEYRPNGPEPKYRLTLGEDYTDLVEGLCGNYDGEDLDDL